MDAGAIQNLISSVGFPIFVAVWMLYKGSKDSEALRDTVNDLKVAITELTAKLADDNKGGTRNDV